jgi:hypothetical protein
MTASSFVEVTDKEISEIKMNSVPKNTKDLCKNTKTIIRLRLGDYGGIFTSTSDILLRHSNYIYMAESGQFEACAKAQSHNDNHTITCIRALIGKNLSLSSY